MLEWIYCDRTDFEIDELVELLGLAHKYELTTLSEICEDSLRGLMSIDNVYTLLIQAP